MQPFQTYLCRVRKGSGSSLFDFDQVCCINFGDVGRLNLEEAVPMVLFRAVGAFFLALVVCLYLRILRCKYPRVCFCTLVFLSIQSFSTPEPWNLFGACELEALSAQLSL